MRELREGRLRALRSVEQLSHALALAPILLVFLFSGEALSAVLGTTGAVQSLQDSPLSVVVGATESDDGVIFFRERRSYELPTDVEVDIVDPGKVNGSLPLSPGTLPAGTRVESYFLHADPASIYARWKGTVTFDREILGIVIRASNLVGSNSVLGAPGTSYDPSSVLEYQGEDVVELLSDRHSLRIDWFVTTHIDQIRVVTRATPGFDYLASFLHRVPNDAIASAASQVEHPLTNDQPSAMLFVTALENMYTDKWPDEQIPPLIVRYDSADRRWGILATGYWEIPDYSTYAILLPEPSSDAFIHTATASNIAGNYTRLDHPGLNGRPSARILVAARDDGVTLDEANFGVWYDGSGWSIFVQDTAVTIPPGTTFNVLVLPDDGTSFVHTTTGSIEHYIDDPRLNGKGWILPQVTQNWNPEGGIGVYNDHPVQMRYHSAREQWSIENSDFTPIASGSAFNIYVPPSPSFSFQHRADADNSIDHLTFIEDEFLDGSPAPILLETPNLAPREGGGAPNPRPTGIYLERALTPPTWGIFNQDATTVYPTGAVSNIYQPPMDLRTFVHEATPDSISGNWSQIRHPATAARRSAIVFVTQQWAPGASPTAGIYNDHNIGVWWNEAEHDWAVFNQDGSPMPDGASFNVFVAKPNEWDWSKHTSPVDPQASAFVHVAAPETLSGDRTAIDHAILNDQSDVQLIVTPNWNPGGVGGVYNDHPIGVDYDIGTGRWSIVNQDGANMPENAAFNVIPVPEPAEICVLAAGLLLLIAVDRRRGALRRSSVAVAP